ncbi:MAG: hypothetical protein GYA36_22790 [Veillonellaceae bacterium]|nr:hypothetical protein [Veillonellaceae bacterium]
MSLSFKPTEKTEKQISEDLSLNKMTSTEISILVAALQAQNMQAIAELSALIAEHINNGGN